MASWSASVGGVTMLVMMLLESLDARTVTICVLKVCQLESVSGSISSRRVDGMWIEEVIGKRVN